MPLTEFIYTYPCLSCLVGVGLIVAIGGGVMYLVNNVIEGYQDMTPPYMGTQKSYRPPLADDRREALNNARRTESLNRNIPNGHGRGYSGRG